MCYSWYVYMLDFLRHNGRVSQLANSHTFEQKHPFSNANGQDWQYRWQLVDLGDDLLVPLKGLKG